MRHSHVFRPFYAVSVYFLCIFAHFGQFLSQQSRIPSVKERKNDQKITKIKLFSKHILNCPRIHYGPLNVLMSLGNEEKRIFFDFFFGQFSIFNFFSEKNPISHPNRKNYSSTSSRSAISSWKIVGTPWFLFQRIILLQGYPKTKYLGQIFHNHAPRSISNFFHEKNPISHPLKYHVKNPSEYTIFSTKIILISLFLKKLEGEYSKFFLRFLAFLAFFFLFVKKNLPGEYENWKIAISSRLEA